ncbi:AOC03_06830 family ribosome hibernation factor [Pseudocalidococcus azoricus]|nr:hypothetical protein [Pseudocalidococcus azoricus]
MICRQNLKHLQAIKAVPAVSILLPTHRTSPDNKRDPIQVKNLVTEAKNRLSQEFKQRQLDPLLQNLEALVAEIDYSYALDGLALYVSHDFAKLYYLPFPVRARVVIDQTFATRDLVYGLHRAERYWLLLLSQGETRLIAGTGETLEEITDEAFPMVMSGPGATSPLPYHADSSYLDDRHRQFFQQVDQALANYAEGESLPLILGGVVRQISFFQEVSQYAAAVAGTITGNFDKASLSELAPQVYPIFQSIRETRRSQSLEELAAAVDAQRVVSTIGEAWRFAHEGRGKTLLVEKNYHEPATVCEAGRLELAAEPGGVGIMDDAVDEIIEVILAKGGDVQFVEDGALALHQKIALILRY